MALSPRPSRKSGVPGLRYWPRWAGLNCQGILVSSISLRVCRVSPPLPAAATGVARGATARFRDISGIGAQQWTLKTWKCFSGSSKQWRTQRQKRILRKSQGPMCPARGLARSRSASFRSWRRSACRETARQSQRSRINPASHQPGQSRKHHGLNPMRAKQKIINLAARLKAPVAENLPNGAGVYVGSVRLSTW